jgi:hypothetical protein
MCLILGQMSRRAPTGIRDRGPITLLYRSGLRISEAVGSPGFSRASAFIGLAFIVTWPWYLLHGVVMWVVGVPWTLICVLLLVAKIVSRRK